MTLVLRQRMRAVVVVSGGYGDEMGLQAVNITVMFVVRYLQNPSKKSSICSKLCINDEWDITNESCQEIY